jgi:hypothetical protein
MLAFICPLPAAHVDLLPRYDTLVLGSALALLQRQSFACHELASRCYRT